MDLLIKFSVLLPVKACALTGISGQKWPALLVFVNAWKGVGYQTVLYLAVISGISNDYYEAAVLDGATRFQQAKYITIPHLRTIIGISLIMSMGNIFSR